MTTRELHAELALDVRAALGEGPVWDVDDRSLVFVDIEGARVHRFTPSSGSHVSFATGDHVGAAVIDREGGLVLALADHFARCGPRGAEVVPIEGFSTDRSLVRFNDGEVDPWGHFVAGTMDWAKRQPIGSLYRLAPDGVVTTLVTGATISNGLAWSTDRRTLYYVDTPTLGVDTFDVGPDGGELLRRRRWVSLDASEHGMPDGIALDADGCLWVACYGGSRVLRFTPDGRIDTIVRLPVSCVTSVAFGGSRLDELFITTARTDLSPAEQSGEPLAGGLFVVSPGVAGMAPARFG